MTVVVKLFGPQASIAGRRECTVETEGDDLTLGRLRELILDQLPTLSSSLGASRFAVNHVFALDDDVIGAGDEVALIGMLGGG